MSQENDSDSSSCDAEEALLDLLGLMRATEKSASLHDFLNVREEVEEPSPALSSSPWPQVHNVFKPITLPPKCSRLGCPPQDCVAVTVENFCNAVECQRIVDLALHQGPSYITEASHTASDGSSYSVPIQNPNPHKLAVFQHSTTFQMLEQRIMQLVLESAPDWLVRYQRRTRYGRVLGLNPRLRVLQYDACDEDHFEAHFDATTVVQGKSSRITVLLYLNTGSGHDFAGGETLFLDNDPVDGALKHEKALHSIAPKVGRLVMFEHDLYHSSAPLESGTKFVLRTDILMEDVSERLDYGDEARMTSVVPGPALLVVADLCQSLQWSQAHQRVLEDMGVLLGSIDTFLVPGRKFLMQMLLEEGLPRSQIDKLLTMAAEYQTNTST